MTEIGFKSSVMLTNLIQVKPANPHLRVANGLHFYAVKMTNGPGPF